MESGAEIIPRQKYDEEIKKVKALYKPDNALNVPSKSLLEFFKWWCIIIRPFMALTDREADVVASFLNQRWELINKSRITDPAILDTLVMSSETVDKVIKECNITKQHFYVVMNTLKKRKAVIEGRINPKLIPNLKNEGLFKLTILFKKEASVA